ncbi:MAG: glutaredoxin family protein [Chloroflexota bacterium]
MLLYSKPGCHLCEQAGQALAELAARGLDFRVEERDITKSPELWERYRDTIPVVEVRGTTLQAPIALHRLEQLILAAGG